MPAGKRRWHLGFFTASDGSSFKHEEGGARCCVSVRISRSSANAPLVFVASSRFSLAETVRAATRLVIKV